MFATKGGPVPLRGGVVRPRWLAETNALGVFVQRVTRDLMTLTTARGGIVQFSECPFVT